MLQEPFKLPCGASIPNRLAKAAMTERISNSSFDATKAHQHLYQQWSKTGAGLLITGNVMIDRKHLESAGNIAFDQDANEVMLKEWAKNAQEKGNAAWVQISHAGRQTNRFSTNHPLAPSAVQLKKMGLFGTPKAMTATQIEAVMKGFSTAAQIAQRVGFSGVQIHAAHGYLLSQFLSPITNKRNDQWGGSLENRSRLLRSIIKNIRHYVGPNFPISVKLNSADFQRGGFTEEESLEVVQMLDQLGIDLLEISGGTYERLAFFEMNDEQSELRESTQKREAYFIDFAQRIRTISKLPLMVTGGFRTRAFCEQVLNSGEVDFIGMARPFITNVEDIPAFLNGDIEELDNLVIRTGNKRLEDMAEGGYYAKQLIRLSRNKSLLKSKRALSYAFFLTQHEMKKALAKKIRN